MTASDAGRPIGASPWWRTLPAFGALAAILAWSEPTSSLVQGYSHDSAYIDRLAQNLVAGNGLVNDALWPVFLKPVSLPMPFHNQNPLYPLSIALVSAGTGVSTTVVGFLVSALAAAALVWGIARLAVELSGLRELQGWILGAACLLFPPVWASVFAFVPDMLAASFLLWCFVWVTRSGGLSPVWAGALFGLSWLTRSTATLAAPAIAAYLVVRWGPWTALRRGAILAGCAVVVVSPWLLYSAEVWGDPFRSDAPFTVVSDYHAVKSYGGDPERYWHAVSFPASFGQVLRSEPIQWAKYWVRGLANVLKQLLKAFAGGGVSRTSGAAVLAVLIAATASTALALRGRWFRSQSDRAALVALGVYGATQVLVFAMLGRAFEIRYVCLFAALTGMCLGGAWLRCLDQARHGTSGGKALAWVVVAAGLVLSLFLAREDVLVFARVRALDPERASYFAIVRRVADLNPSEAPVVVGQHPYFYSLATTGRSLSIPLDDEGLAAYMARYHARFVILTNRELEYWRPQWMGGRALPDFLRIAHRWDGAVVFELVPRAAGGNVDAGASQAKEVP